MRKLLFLLLISLTLTALAGDDGKQKQRREFINKAITLGVIKKIDGSAAIPHMWVTPAYMDFDFDQKNAIASVVYQYLYIDSDKKPEFISIYDSKTGKSIGTYTPGNLSIK